MENIKKAKKKASPEKNSKKKSKNDPIKSKEETKDGNSKLIHAYTRSMFRDEDSEPEDNRNQRTRQSKYRKYSDADEKEESVSKSQLCVNCGNIIDPDCQLPGSKNDTWVSCTMRISFKEERGMKESIPEHLMKSEAVKSAPKEVDYQQKINLTVNPVEKNRKMSSSSDDSD